MPNLGGFEVVGELTQEVLNQILQGAWDNNIIPHSVDVPAGTAFGPYQVADGVVNIPRAGVSLVMDPPINGVAVTLASEIQVEIANPPIEAARFFDMQADVVARVPLGVLPDSIKVAAMLAGIPRADVSANLTSGDPIPPLTLAAIEQYVHERYQDGTIPDHISQEDATFGAFSADVWVDIYDDATHPTHRIAVAEPAPGKIKILIPIHVKLSDLSLGLSPAGVVAKVAITADLERPPGSVTARLSTATVDVEDFAPAPASDALGSYDNEGTNFSLNNTGSGGLLESVLRSQIQAQGQAIVAALGDITVAIPTVDQIETFIADQAHAALVGRGDIPLWTPEPPPGGGVTVDNVRPLALADAVAFCLNDPGGADTSVIVNFIPAGRSCGIAISAAKVTQIIDEQIHRPEDEGGFGPDFPPHTFDDVDGHEAILTRLSVSLVTGSIHLEGDVTVVDAIADSIDVDASFEAEVGLEWEDTAEGGQMIRPFTISEDVDLSLLAWIVSFLLGFISFGLVGGIIALVVVAVVEGIAERIGGAVIRDEVTGQIRGIGAWPQQLEGIGEVTSRFENPIEIDPQGILFADAYQVKAIFASVVDALAEANGPYIVPEGAEVEFHGGPARPHTTYSWEFGDGESADGAVVQHRYADDGLYVAKLTTAVEQEGGVVTRHFAAVRVENVAATVDAGLPLTLNEGEEHEFVADFTDPGWPDTHVAYFDFGDDSAPELAEVTETHDPPLGRGRARVRHAYCDDGEYTVTVRVRDDDGGIGVGTRHVTVGNVVPRVDAGDRFYAYPCTPVTLVARFRDPGWCDTHTATWDFGDCTPPIPATVRERNEPPVGCGIAAATHRYSHCGSYHAVARVTDDEGATGEDWVVVEVVDVRNGGFESGFHLHPPGAVANGWEPYLLSTSTSAAGTDQNVFAAEEFVVHRGQRSQRVNAVAGGRAGVFQRVGANPGWDYQVSAWVHLSPDAGGRWRLGLDASGGTDPAAPGVIWTGTDQAREWEQLAVRVTATGAAVSIFVEHVGGKRGEAGWLDDVEILPYPCRLPEVPPCAPREAERTCVDWREERRPRQLPPEYQADGFTFASGSNEPLRIVVWGSPTGVGKLAIPRKRLEIRLPFPADVVSARVSSGTAEPIVLEAFAEDGTRIGRVESQSGISGVERIEISATGITRVELTGGGGEGLLVELCVGRDEASGDVEERHSHTTYTTRR